MRLKSQGCSELIAFQKKLLAHTLSLEEVERKSILIEICNKPDSGVGQYLLYGEVFVVVGLAQTLWENIQSLSRDEQNTILHHIISDSESRLNKRLLQEQSINTVSNLLSMASLFSAVEDLRSKWLRDRKSVV